MTQILGRAGSRRENWSPAERRERAQNNLLEHKDSSFKQKCDKASLHSNQHPSFSLKLKLHRAAAGAHIMATSCDSSKAACKVLLGLTGSVASVKYAELACALREVGFEVRIIGTSSAEVFTKLASGYDPPAFDKLQALQPPVQTFSDRDEWASYMSVKKDPVLHIELRKWADIFLIAPLSANSLGKLAHGLCDNLLTCVARAWDFTAAPTATAVDGVGRAGSASGKAVGREESPPTALHRHLQKPFLVAPAMNTAMWKHPFTQPSLARLQSLGISVIPPVRKVLACGDIGDGAMASVQDIVLAVQAAALAVGKSLPGQERLVEEAGRQRWHMEGGEAKGAASAEAAATAAAERLQPALQEAAAEGLLSPGTLAALSAGALLPAGSLAAQLKSPVHEEDLREQLMQTLQAGMRQEHAEEERMEGESAAALAASLPDTGDKKE